MPSTTNFSRNGRTWKRRKSRELPVPQSAPRGWQMGTPKCMNFENHWGSLGFNKALLSFIAGMVGFISKGPKHIQPPRTSVQHKKFMLLHHMWIGDMNHL